MSRPMTLCYEAAPYAACKLLSHAALAAEGTADFSEHDYSGERAIAIFFRFEAKGSGGNWIGASAKCALSAKVSDDVVNPLEVQFVLSKEGPQQSLDVLARAAGVKTRFRDRRKIEIQAADYLCH